MEKVFRLHVVAAEYGDCLWMEYGKEDELRRVLIDAGTVGVGERVKQMLRKVRKTAPSHELFIITHVDRDHIGGSLEVMKDADCQHQFKDIWFNGYHHLVNATSQKTLGAVQGDKLTDWLVAKNLPWNKAFNGNAVHLASDSAPPEIKLEDGMTVTILSPGLTQLSNMIGRWEDEVRRAGLDQNATPEERKARVGEQAFGGIDIDSLANSYNDRDREEPNGTSIATLFKYEGGSALLAADAHPDVLIQSITKLANGRKLEVDVFKLPHHGSKKNVTRQLMALVSAKAYIFSTNGNSYGHPNKEAVARVIQAHGPGANLIFNYHTEFNELWEDPDLQAEHGYKVDFGEGENGILVDILALKGRNNK